MNNNKYFTLDEIQFHKKLISKEYIEVKKLEAQIKNHNNNIESLKSILIANCAHVKVRDSMCYDHTTYHCGVCDQDL